MKTCNTFVANLQLKFLLIFPSRVDAERLFFQLNIAKCLLMIWIWIEFKNTVQVIPQNIPQKVLEEKLFLLLIIIARTHEGGPLRIRLHCGTNETLPTFLEVKFILFYNGNRFEFDIISCRRCLIIVWKHLAVMVMLPEKICWLMSTPIIQRAPLANAVTHEIVSAYFKRVRTQFLKFSRLRNFTTKFYTISKALISDNLLTMLVNFVLRNDKNLNFDSTIFIP